MLIDRYRKSIVLNPSLQNDRKKKKGDAVSRGSEEGGAGGTGGGF